MHNSFSAYLCALTTVFVLTFGNSVFAQDVPVNGLNVKAVEYSKIDRRQGYFTELSEKTWTQVTPQSIAADGSWSAETKTVTWRETGRDEWSVYLISQSGDVSVQIDLWTKKVKRAGEEIGKVSSSSATPKALELAPIPVNGQNVTEVAFGNEGGVKGYFAQVGDKAWNRLKKDRTVVATYTESGRDEWSVYLTDPNGKGDVTLNLWLKTVTLGKRALGDVVTSSNTPLTAPTLPTITETPTPADVAPTQDSPPTPVAPTQGQVVQGTAVITSNPVAGEVVQAQQTDSTVVSAPTRSAEIGGQIVLAPVSNSGPIYVGPNDPKPLPSIVCAQGIDVDPRDDWMMSMWPAVPTTASSDLLVQAAVKMLNKHGQAVTDAALAKVAADVKTDPVARFRFAPFMLQTFFEALTTGTPTAEQAAYKAYFERSQGCADYYRAVNTLRAWNQYQGTDQSIGPAKPYEPTLLSAVNFSQSPSVSGFIESDPLDFGPRGGEAVALLYLPMAAKNGLMDENPMAASIGSLGDDMTAVAVGAGIGTGALASAVLMGSTVAYVSAAATAALAPAIESAQAGLAAAQSAVALAQSQGPAAVKLAEIGVVGAEKLLAGAQSATVSWGPSLANFAGPAIVVVVAAAILATTIAEVAKKAVFEEKLKKAAENPYFSVAEYMNVPDEEKKTRRGALFTLMVKQLIANPAQAGRLTLELPEYPCPTGHARGSDKSCVLEVRFHSQAGMTMDQAQQLSLQNSWRIATAHEVERAWRLLGFEAFAFGLLADGSYAVPVQRDMGSFKRGANIGAQGGNQGFFYTPRVEYRTWGGLTLKQAQDITGHDGDRLASAQEVETAWSKQGLNVFAYGLLDDGRFAVPLQNAQGNFPRGPNIGAQGGNQGFFFVRNAEQTPGDMYYRGQQPLECPRGTRNEDGLCYTPCEAGYTAVATRCYADCPAGFRNDGLYCGKPDGYFREGFGWQGGDPPLPNYSGPIGRCEAKYGAGACEQAGAVIYPKCRANFYAATVNLCSPNCPSGMNDIGVSCAKNFRDRGVGQPVSVCPAGTEQIGLLCYPLCRSGFHGQLDWCYKD